MYPITIVIPVKNPPDLEEFIHQNSEVFKECCLIIIDSGGGESLKQFSSTYIQKEMTFWEARHLAYTLVKTPFTLNLDVDVVIPNGYIADALALLDKKADVVSIFYEDINHCQGALEYGISMWKTEVLRRLYDFSMDKVMDGKIVKVGSMTYSTLNNGWCECTYLWRKLKSISGKLETLPIRAKHLK